jgi:hypothetical protein
LAPREKLEQMELHVVHGTCSSPEAEKMPLVDVVDKDGRPTIRGLKFIADAGLREGGIPAGRDRHSNAHDALKMILRLVHRSEA